MSGVGSIGGGNSVGGGVGIGSGFGGGISLGGFGSADIFILSSRMIGGRLKSVWSKWQTGIGRVKLENGNWLLGAALLTGREVGKRISDFTFHISEVRRRGVAGRRRREDGGSI